MAFPEAADVAPVETDLGRAYVVRFLNCTSNKPLHLGHLRNVALGEAVVETLRALGAHAVRHCVLEDTGRYMTEAMVAIREAEAGGMVLPEPGPGTDHFVGTCYAAYRKARAERAASAAEGGEDAPPAAASTHYEGSNENADALMRGLLANDEDVLDLRARVRRLALAGQEATLERLGVTFDYCDFESAEDEGLGRFLAACRRRGPLRKNDKGEDVWTAALGGNLRLAGKNGLAEESARLLSLNARIARSRAAAYDVIVLAGSEWKASMVLYSEFLGRLGIRMDQKYMPTFYGMLTLKGKKMASSEGTGVLVDKLVERIAGDQRLQNLAARSGDGVTPERLAGCVIRSFLLSTARTDKIEYSDDLVASPDSNPGWSIVAGWAATSQDYPGAVSRPCRAILLDGVSRRSFERATGRAGELGALLAAGSCRPRDKADFGFLVRALSLVPESSPVDFASLPSFLSAGTMS